MSGVKGIVLNSSVLFAKYDDENGDISLVPGADHLLRRLRYSKIPIGLSYRQCLSAPKASLLQELGSTYSYDCFIWSSSWEADISNQVRQIWGDGGGVLVHVVSSCREDLLRELNIPGWSIITIGSASRKSSTGGISNIFYADKLEELPMIICQLNKKAMSKENLIVGYVMKPSREEDFAKRGAFPLHPTQNGMSFFPLSFELPISSQLQQVDAVLHKATDEILSVQMSSSSAVTNEVTFTRNMQELRRNVESRPDCCLIDPFSNFFPVLDRLKIQQILLGLETVNKEGHNKIRGPRFLKVDSFDEPKLEKWLVEAKLSLPNIVKPQVACGVADAHSMAIVFKVDDYKVLSIPLPAIVQEYVDHSSLIFKFYVLGSKLFYAVKKSIPSADMLMSLSKENGLQPLLFDSLKSLPVSKEQVDTNCHHIDIGLVTDAADWLRRKLDLTIFGFDVVIQEGTGDHVIVDLNYLPSFKEVPDDVAIPAFWGALKEKIHSSKLNKAKVV